MSEDLSLILMADDDQDDRDMAVDALAESQLTSRLEFVVDGQDLLDYLRGEGNYAGGSASAPKPAIILLDLNMPRKDGFEALAEIKSDEGLRRIPVIALTTSRDEIDVRTSYDLGATSYITKPMTFTGLVEVMDSLTDYWFNTVELPSDTDERR